ncbi:hypothetical protein [Microbacterium sp.]|uniref:hypothetical protein n=1 Tax=Microbacterium sp. TaxID=51671 RepID=UPI002811404C|nr:hypothetical protein [Microbacterium sp.]
MGSLLLALLLVVDAAVIALHLAYTLLGVPAGVHFDLGVDRSYGEFLLYIKFGWIALLCALLARRRRSAAFAAVAAGSLMLLLEDALILHERVGWALEPVVLRAAPGLAGLGILSVQVGELLWLATLALTISTVFLISWRRAGARDRRDALSIVVFFAVMGFFAVVVDTAHSPFALGSAGDMIFTVLEDGGEIVALTPAVALAFSLALTSLNAVQGSTVTSPTSLSGLSPRHLE